jgi:hypothetical protein
MSVIGEVKDALEVGLLALNYLNAREVDEHTRAVIGSLRRIYFEQSTLELIKDIPAAAEADRHDLVRRLEQKLLEGRYEVHRSLKVLAEEGLNAELSLRQRRLIDLICMGKGQIRSKIFYSIRKAVESDGLNIVSELLEDIDKLNTAIEEVEEKLGERRART